VNRENVLRRDALDAWRVGVRAASPAAAVERALDIRPEIRAGLDRTLVVGTGKAAAAMVRGVGPAARGVILVPETATSEGVPPGVRVEIGGHPLPTIEGIAASRAVLAAAERLTDRDRLLYLVSGGSSALFEVPLAGIDDDDIIDTYALLLASGMPIDEMNCVRRALSAVKGGGLARAAAAAEIVTLAVSDVPGDVPADIGSGPTVAADDSPARALELCERYGLLGALPTAVAGVLRGRAMRPAAVSRAPVAAAALNAGGAERVAPRSFLVVVSAGEAEAAAEERLEALGYELIAAPMSRLSGDAAAAACALLPALDAARGGSRRAFVVSGETTVRLPAAHGRGGRNQHIAAIVAGGLAGHDGFACMVGGTDGRDGDSDAAGGLIDGTTAARAAAAGHDLRLAVARFDTATALAAARDAVVTGPTGTNVGDLLVATFAGPARAK
jgi:hydroxypyruvate reductase